MNKLMYTFVATRKKKKKRNQPVFRHGMPLQGIPRKNVCLKCITDGLDMLQYLKNIELCGHW